MNLTKTSGCVVIAVAWILSIGICLPVFVRPSIGIDYSYCKTNDLDAIVPGLTGSTIVLAFYLPLFIIIVCYSVVFVRVKQKIDQKVAAKMEQLEILSYSQARPSNQVNCIKIWIFVSLSCGVLSFLYKLSILFHYCH